MSDFIFSVVLTAMDVLVFALTVDKGLTPVALVGACYIALRLFGRDSQKAVALWEPFLDKFRVYMSGMKLKMEARKEEDASEE